MLCDGCHENEAVICYTEIINGVKKELHLCEACAAKETGLGMGGGHTFISLTDTSFLANLLASVLGIRQDKADDENLKKTNIICPSCQMTYNEFLKYGTFGCPECYKTFNFLLDGYLKKIQGSCEHTGDMPFSGETVHIPAITLLDEADSAGENQDETIAFTVDESSSEEELRAALKRAVAREEYEEAARIRDMIRAGKEGENEHA